MNGVVIASLGDARRARVPAARTLNNIPVFFLTADGPETNVAQNPESMRLERCKAFL